MSHDLSHHDGVTPRIRLLLLLPTQGFGGAERTLYNLITHLDPARFEIILITHRSSFPACDRARVLDLEAEGVATGFQGLRRTWGDARRVWAIARREQCHLMLGFLHYGGMIAALVRVLGRGRPATIASPRTPSVAGIRFHLSRRRDRWLWHALVLLMNQAAHRVLVSTEGLGRECIQRYRAAPDKVTVVANCVDLSAVYHAQAQPRSDTLPCIVTFGRLAPEKDLDILLRAFAQVRVHHPCRLLLIGDGPERAGLETLCQTLDIAPWVRFAGFHPAPFGLVKSADIFVHTARFEGFGNVLIEAMACDLPVLATDCDFGPREIIRHGETGLLVRPGSVDALAQGIRTLLADEPLRRRLATAARQDLPRYAPAVMAQGYAALFEALFRERHGAANDRP
ncbi:Glycosyltransferase involved in cell wall bisynthesis [Ectothiorhodospira magna]|uniref:Glycosyltransferase involved in cell wall bisynthesis n=1 Tax=Ectothiorhodospira magna TaxID=867345 RepID=A0A1H9BJC2_9GAMM|nr:glycosyltransferase [Ectothiorhodospira magna]SEP89100.1 Glycosyltransferase involved in cell wall bisynthesis [Ectothiorhodospira magna]